MSRPKEHNLYKVLIYSQFSFIKRGIKTIDEIYSSVKDQNPSLCDDSYYCSKNCLSGNDQAEWKHTVRNALQRLKSNNGPIVYTGRRGFWQFLP